MTGDGLPDLTGLEGTEAASEAPRLAAGEPWCSTEIAGLQFYAYGSTDELTGERIIPLPGDRLHLVREPANEHDANAVQVWWRNGHMLGHLPRSVAAAVAPLLDGGAPARAYVAQPGDGEAWTLEALVVGPAAGPLWARHIEHVAYRALGRSDEDYEREERYQGRAERTRDSMELHRRRRLRAAVETLLTAPCDVTLPEPYESGRTDVEGIAEVLRCSRSTVVRLGAKHGIRIGRYDGAVALTPSFEAELRAWARKPRKKAERIPAREIRVRGCHRETDTGGYYAWPR